MTSIKYKNFTFIDPFVTIQSQILQMLQQGNTIFTAIHPLRDASLQPGESSFRVNSKREIGSWRVRDRKRKRWKRSDIRRLITWEFYSTEGTVCNLCAMPRCKATRMSVLEKPYGTRTSIRQRLEDLTWLFDGDDSRDASIRRHIPRLADLPPAHA